MLISRKAVFSLAVPIVMLSSATAVAASTARAIAAKVLPSVATILIEGKDGKPVSQGSGFVVGGGFVATNVHVLAGGYSGWVRFPGSDESLKILGVAGVDYSNDLALLAVSTGKIETINLGSTKTLAIGDRVYAAGSPLGLESTFSSGMISSLRSMNGMAILQITAAISPGSSGGPVVDETGRVVGVAVATVEKGQSLNFAIPVEALKKLLKDSEGTCNDTPSSSSLVCRLIKPIHSVAPGPQTVKMPSTSQKPCVNVIEIDKKGHRTDKVLSFRQETGTGQSALVFQPLRDGLLAREASVVCRFLLEIRPSQTVVPTDAAQYWAAVTTKYWLRAKQDQGDGLFWQVIKEGKGSTPEKALINVYFGDEWWTKGEGGGSNTVPSAEIFEAYILKWAGE